MLFAFAAGRYYEPRIEERALIFFDMRSSTAIAERLGERAFLAFLNRFVADLSLAIADAGGEIHKYVGDEVIATWSLAPVRMSRPASGPAFPRSIGFKSKGRLTSESSGGAPTSAPLFTAAGSRSASSARSRKRSR